MFRPPLGAAASAGKEERHVKTTNDAWSLLSVGNYGGIAACWATTTAIQACMRNCRGCEPTPEPGRTKCETSVSYPSFATVLWNAVLYSCSDICFNDLRPNNPGRFFTRNYDSPVSVTSSRLHRALYFSFLYFSLLCWTPHFFSNFGKFVGT